MKLYFTTFLLIFLSWSCSDENNPLGTVGGIQDDHCPAGVDCSPAKLVLVGPNPIVFPTTTVGSSSTKMVTFENQGGFDAKDIQVENIFAPFTYAGGSYPGTNGTCGTVIASGAQCSVNLEFMPTATNTYTSKLTLEYLEDPQVRELLEIDLQGDAVSTSALVLSDGPVFNFGTVVQGGTATKLFTLTNPSTGQATAFLPQALTGGFSFSGGVFPGTGGTCATALAGGASCTIGVSFSPTAIGPQNDRLEIGYFNGASNLSVVRDMVATVNFPANIVVAGPSPIVFSPTALSSTNTYLLNLVNTGGTVASNLSNAALTAPFDFPGGGFPGTNGNCGATLNVGSTCVVELTYTPTTSGSHADTFGLNYLDGVNPQALAIPVSGSGSSNAVLEISDGLTFNFGSTALGTTLTKVFTVTNMGASTATLMNSAALAAPFSFTGGGYPGTGGDCGTTLASAGTCLIEVSFNPTVVGVVNSTVAINYNNGAGGLTASRPVTGSGQGPAQLLSLIHI